MDSRFRSVQQLALSGSAEIKTSTLTSSNLDGTGNLGAHLIFHTKKGEIGTLCLDVNKDLSTLQFYQRSFTKQCAQNEWKHNSFAQETSCES